MYGQVNIYTDTFPAFAFKVLAAVKGIPDGNRTKFLQAKQVRFNGFAVNKTMMTAVSLSDGKIDRKGLDILHRIERNHGREMLSMGYVKLLRSVQTCSKLAGDLKEDVQYLVNYCLTQLDFSLRRLVEDQRCHRRVFG